MHHFQCTTEFFTVANPKYTLTKAYLAQPQSFPNCNVVPCTDVIDRKNIKILTLNVALKTLLLNVIQGFAESSNISILVW